MLRVGHLAEEARYSHHALCPLCLFVLYQWMPLCVQCVLDDVVGTAHSLDMPQILCLQGGILGCSLCRMAQYVFCCIMQELKSLHGIVREESIEVQSLHQSFEYAQFILEYGVCRGFI